MGNGRPDHEQEESPGGSRHQNCRNIQHSRKDQAQDTRPPRRV
jgi:hypothetical protein